MRIALATDAWAPQTNGVVRTLSETRRCLEAAGHEVLMLTPEGFHTLPMPTYPEIRLALRPGPALARAMDRFRPEAIHVATEGPIGFAARRYCLRHGLAFTTSWHTQFPRYVRMRAPVPESFTYALLRRFHGAAACTLVPTPAVRDELDARGFGPLAIWGRGVDTRLFDPDRRDDLGLPRPVLMYMGRVSVEKNVEAFLALRHPGNKVVVGDGPARRSLEARHPDVLFTGARYGEALARTLASADVFVFPSRTDTFGLVLLEAMASGVPVAAFPAPGPIDVVDDGVTGALDEDLDRAVVRAQTLSRTCCRKAALARSWEAATRQFHAQLVPATGGAAPRHDPVGASQ